MHCLICGEENDRWFAATVWHFRPIDWEERRFIWGNFREFGFWFGLHANITLLFPFLDTILNWRYRKHRLVFADGSDLQPMCTWEPKNDRSKAKGTL